MTNAKNSGKAFYVTLITMILCCAMFCGSTYAWFSTTVRNTNNKIVVGVLDAELYEVSKKENATTEIKVSEETDLFDGVIWVPGMICYRNLTVKNEGDIAFNYKAALEWGDYNTIEGKSVKTVLKVAVVEGHIENETMALEKATLVKWNGFTDVLEGNLIGSVSGETVDTKEFAIVVYWEPTNTDSDYIVVDGKATSDGNPLFVKLGLTLTATQVNAEARD